MLLRMPLRVPTDDSALRLRLLILSYCLLNFFEIYYPVGSFRWRVEIYSRAHIIRYQGLLLGLLLPFGLLEHRLSRPLPYSVLKIFSQYLLHQDIVITRNCKACFPILVLVDHVLSQLLLNFILLLSSLLTLCILLAELCQLQKG